MVPLAKSKWCLWQSAASGFDPPLFISHSWLCLSFMFPHLSIGLDDLIYFYWTLALHFSRKEEKEQARGSQEDDVNVRSY